MKIVYGRAHSGKSAAMLAALEPMVMLKHFAYNPQLQASGLPEEEE